MPTDPLSNLPEPGAEPKVSADDLIAQAADVEMDRLFETGDDGLEPPRRPLRDEGLIGQTTGTPAVKPLEPEEPADSASSLEGEVVAAVLAEAGDVKDGEVEALLATLAQGEGGALPVSPGGAAPVSVEPNSVMSPLVAAPVAATTSGLAGAPEAALQSVVLKPAAKAVSAHVGPPFMSAASEWKPARQEVDVLRALPEPEYPLGMGWLVRLLVAVNRPFGFLSPEVRRNLGYVACAVMVSAGALSAWARWVK